MFNKTKKDKRKLNKRKERCISMIKKINENKHTDNINSNHVLLKSYGKEIEEINRELFVSKYCF